MRVFATGGIGGVHRGWTERLDVSADLRAIATTPVCVLCAGAKSILDIEATREALEALGVPVFGYRTDRFPLFHARAGADVERTEHVARVESAGQVAERLRVQWETLALRTGVLVVNPVPEAHALSAHEVERAVAAAEARAVSRGVRGAERTPFLLAQLEEQTNGRSLVANVSLLVANAAVAGSIAFALAQKTAHA